ncbi:MAG: heme o synthase [Acidilobaceae archaeon]
MGDAIVKLRSFIELTKPRQLALLLLTMYGSYIVAGGPLDFISLTKLTIMGFATVGGVTALNMYLDYDVDSVMARTRRRPLPSGRLSLDEALLGTVILLVLGVTIAASINKYVLSAVLAGLYFDIIAYTELSKRFTALNIIFGSIAGAMPALGGWAAGAGSITLPGILLASIVFAWQPLHVWFLAYSYGDDYRRAEIPMVSLSYSHRVFSIVILIFLALMAIAMATLVYYLKYGLIALALTLILISLATLRVLRFYRGPSREEAFKIYKFATPTLAIVYIVLPLEFLISNYIIISLLL